MLRTLAVIVVGLFAGLVPVVAGADPLDDLVSRYRSVSGRHDDVAYATQRQALEDIADYRTDAARRRIKELISEEGTEGKGRSLDRRRVVLLLSALVRSGAAEEIDAAIRIAESLRDEFVLTSLSRAFASVKDPAGKAHLRGPALSRATPDVKAQIARALGALGDTEAVVPLLAALREGDVGVRAEALSALGEIREPSAFPSMVVFLSAPEPNVREVAARALGVLGCARAVAYLSRALTDPVARVVESAANALAVLSSPAAVPALIDRLAAVKGQDLRLEEALEQALARITGVQLGVDADLWRAWWRENKDKPPADPAASNAPTTVAGPRYYGFAVRSSRVVFVVDVSRSMGWNDRLGTAQRELKQAIEHLPPSTRFNVISFSDVADAWSEKLVPATPTYVKQALRFVDRLEPTNGTNIHAALRLAFKEEEADTVFFMTDGTPTVGAIIEPDQILAEMRETNRWRRVRIHTIALLRGEPPGAYAGHEDPASAASFMQRLAEENDGKFREVR